jgi:hypothetical protein
VSGDYLETALLGACPGLRETWDAVRRTHRDGSAPDDDALMTEVRLHVVGLLVTGRVAEFTRFARSIERLLGEADPILHDLLRDHLIRPLAQDIEAARVEPARVTPHLGPRTGLVWRA